jgi:hypothetical protein
MSRKVYYITLITQTSFLSIFLGDNMHLLSHPCVYKNFPLHLASTKLHVHNTQAINDFISKEFPLQFYIKEINNPYHSHKNLPTLVMTHVTSSNAKLETHNEK